MISWQEKIFGGVEERLESGPRRRRIWSYLGIYTIAFLAAFLIAYSPFLREGKTFIWSVDGKDQHLQTLAYVGRSVRQAIMRLFKGDFSVPLYDPSFDLGSDIIGSLNPLGLNDPLLLLSALFPVRYVEYCYAFLMVLRIWLAGLSFAYLCFYFKKKPIYTLTGSIAYCFSGYVIYTAARHPYYIIPMIQLPLLVAGIEKILRRERPYVFIFAMFYAGMCEYYHLYMMTIMLAVYAVLRVFDIYTEGSASARWKERVLAAVRVLGAALLGLGLAAVVLGPALMTYLDADRSGFSNYTPPNYSWKHFRWRLLWFIAPTNETSWTFLAMAAIVLMAAVLMLFSRNKRTLKILFILGAAILVTGLGGLIMNGFQYSSNRWSFGLCLLASFVLVDMMPSLIAPDRKQKAICFITVCAYTFIVYSSAIARKKGYCLVAVCFLLFTMLWVNMYTANCKERLSGSKHLQTFKALICLLLVVINVGVNGIYKNDSDLGNYIAEFNAFGSEAKALEDSPELALAPYMEEFKGRGDGSRFSVNDAMVWRVPGMLTYNSVINENIAEFWKKIENVGNYQSFFIFSTDQRTMIDTLLSGLYQVETEETAAFVPYGYEPAEEPEHAGKLRDGEEWTDWQVYENRYALPWGYTYDAVMPYSQLDSLSAIEREQAMLQAVALETVPAEDRAELVFDETEIPYEMEMEGCSWEDGTLNVSSAGAAIRLSFAMPKDVEGYVRLNGFDINDSGLETFYIKVNCGYITKSSQAASTRYSWYFGRENYLFNLGYSGEERSELTITFPSKGTFKLRNIELYALPMDNYPAWVEALRAEPLENIQWGTNSLTGTVDLSRDKILCVSVPYKDGWTALVDGEEVEILRGNYMFMCVPLTAGHHDIAFRYCSPGLKAGAALSAASAVIVACMLIFDRRGKKARKA